MSAAKEVLLVAATRGAADALPVEAREALERIRREGQGFQYEIVANNTDGLPAVYNRYLVPEHAGRILVFMHDDVVVHDVTLVQRLREATTRFDVVGLVGTARLVMGSPVLWYSSPKEGWSGGVVHATPATGQVVPMAFGPARHPCLVLDGLFIAVNTERVLQAGVTWDEEFQFHFYDLSFCLRARAAGLTCGTWDIPVTHFSWGNPRSDSWVRQEHLFLERYGDWVCPVCLTMHAGAPFAINANGAA